MHNPRLSNWEEYNLRFLDAMLGLYSVNSHLRWFYGGAAYLLEKYMKSWAKSRYSWVLVYTEAAMNSESRSAQWWPRLVCVGGVVYRCFAPGSVPITTDPMLKSIICCCAMNVISIHALDVQPPHHACRTNNALLDRGK